MSNDLLSNFFVKPEWNQFWPSMIATFFGFILALIGEYLLETKLERRKHNNDVKELLERLVTELEDVKKILDGLNQYSLDKNPLKTPVWDEAINVGLVALIDVEARKQLFTVYKKINEFNSWYEIKTNYYFSHFNDLDKDGKFDVSKRYNSELNDEIERQKELLVGTNPIDKAPTYNKNSAIDIVIETINTTIKRMNKHKRKRNK